MNTETPEPWDTAKIREAFIHDGGEAEYYDPINGAREHRRFAGEVFDRWLAAHDAEVLERGVAHSWTEYGIEFPGGIAHVSDDRGDVEDWAQWIVDGRLVTREARVTEWTPATAEDETR